MFKTCFKCKIEQPLTEDCWEWDCKEYTFHFIWNLYAIAWAIRKYDAAKVPAATTTHED